MNTAFMGVSPILGHRLQAGPATVVAAPDDPRPGARDQAPAQDPANLALMVTRPCDPDAKLVTAGTNLDYRDEKLRICGDLPRQRRCGDRTSGLRSIDDGNLLQPEHTTIRVTRSRGDLLGHRSEPII
jgi:hypothetical protein